MGNQKLMFASRLNFQLDKYISWKPDPQAMDIDAFTVSWTNIFIYAFPPFSLIAKVIQKIELDKVDKALLIVPFWPTQPWFSKLTKMLVNCPFLLSRSHQTVTHPVTGEQHPLRSLKLMACSVSTTPSRIRDFHNKLLTYYCPHGEIAPRDNTQDISINGYNIVSNKALITCHQI